MQITLNGNHFPLKCINKYRNKPKDMSSFIFRNVFQTFYPFQMLFPAQIFKRGYF